MHSFYDMQMFSKQTIDAYVLLMKGGVNWDALIVRANEYRVTLPLMYLLEGVRAVFGSVPVEGESGQLKLKGLRKWLAYRLLTGDRRMSLQPGIGFRLRQLAAQFLLSGNATGWIRYYINYSSSKFRDLIYSFRSRSET